MASYVEKIEDLGADHLWTLDAIYTDEIGSVTGTNSGGIVTEIGICTDAIKCWSSDTIKDDRIDLGSETDICNSIQTYKAVGGWFNTSKVQPHPCRIYGEGNTNTFHFVLAMGNNILFEVGDTDGIAQVFGISLVANRNYHIFGLMDNGQIELFIDGISQGTGSGYGSTLSSRSPAAFADPAGDCTIGGDKILLQAAVNGRYNYWGTWDGTIPTSTQIRNELFARGALAEVEITSQADLDNYANTFRNNSPLSFNITGTNLDLIADNITFDYRCSLHIRWEGSGTLNWTNTNNSNAVTIIATNGGTVNIINPHTLTINNIANPSEVRVYEAGTLTEVSGQEDVINGTFVEDINVTNVDIIIYSVTFKPVTFKNLLINKNTILNIEQFFDRNYKNS